MNADDNKSSASSACSCLLVGVPRALQVMTEDSKDCEDSKDSKDSEVTTNYVQRISLHMNGAITEDFCIKL